MRWDAGKRALAAQMDRLEPGWHVMYGLWSRRFYAIATCCPVAMIVEARTPEELRERMREGELEAMTSVRAPMTKVA
ncbi:hypothetical protein Ssi03_52740 [Sphaerisporangium siamense]|uniref:hypothetical protein n=1 Tax=Sphaerisporangium siamense TaxID=795645 RepID=UPI00160A8F13|nr:hypothetical protein [Sphaerisporangium siamense]GII87284.1 hypothetical protein Ssi03_52740 [Sphaerisporangium siamense]